MYFGSDNSAGAAPQLLEALVKANEGNAPSYGADEWCARASARLAEVFEHPVAVFYVTTGTAANALALAALTPPYGAVLCHQEAHINVDECAAPEFFTGGAKLLPIAGEGAKITLPALQDALANLPRHVPHNCPLKLLSLTQATECGLVYTPSEVAALAATAKNHGMRVHMDGARFANAIAHLGCTPAELTWKAGVDVLCLGATKDGALGVEAVIFFDAQQAENFQYLVKRSGQLVSKSRWLGAQMEAWLQNGLWLDLARAANQKASELADVLLDVPGVHVVWRPEANSVFAVLSAEVHARLQAAGAVYYDWPRYSLPAGQHIKSDDVYVRFVTSFRTSSSNIESLRKAAIG